MEYTIRYSERYEDVKLIHDNLYAYNLSKTGYAPQKIVLPDNTAWRTFLIVRTDGEILGGCCWHVREPDRMLFIDFLWMADASRGLGCGTALIRSVEAKAKELKCPGVELLTQTFQAPDFYRKMGFTAVHEEKAPEKNCPENIHYIFRKTF